jgi:hypothetical protein
VVAKSEHSETMARINEERVALSGPKQLAHAGPTAIAVGQKQASSLQPSAASSNVTQAAAVVQAASPWRGMRLAQVNPTRAESPRVGI